MNAKRIVLAMAALFALTLAPAAYAADNNTEFGIEDDLTVLGTAGTAVDPDAEIKGFTVFGATQAAPALNIPVAPGNIFANGYVQVSSGMYVAGSSTFTSGAYFTGISSFAAGPGNMYVSGGTAGQVLSKVAGGGMQWSDVSAMVSGDNLGNHVATTTLNMASFDVKNAGYITASSAALSGQIVVYGTSTLTGQVGVGGALGVTGAATLSDNLTVNGNTTLGNAPADWIVAKSSTTVDINGGAIDDTAAFAVKGIDSSGVYAAKFYSGASLAAWIKKK